MPPSSIKGSERMRLLLLLVVVLMVTERALTNALPADAENDIGYFWHITDLHYDQSFNQTTPSGWSCGTPDGKPPTTSGSYGSYLCDSPWLLINSSVRAMKHLRPNVDFIIWTGDDTPHNKELANATVAEIIQMMTDEIHNTFPNTTVFPVLGNHDWSPKSQLPPKDDPFYATIADIWAVWIKDQKAIDTFKRSGFYCTKLNDKVLLLGLNTNLYYDSNKITPTMVDPGNQLQWMDDLLTNAAKQDLKVILIGHVPPGHFEKHETKHWFWPHYNELFVGLLRKHSAVFGSLHFGHHHTDSFRIFYDDKGVAVGSFFIAPAVTPWETTLPGVMGGAGNNPGIRLVEYIRSTGQVTNVLQYYLDLVVANSAAPGAEVQWQLAYDAVKYYSVPDMMTSSLDNLADRLWTDDDLFTSYYQANGLYFDRTEQWTADFRVVHCCSIAELDYTNYTKCVDSHRATSRAAVQFAPSTLMQFVITAAAALLAGAVTTMTN